MRIHAYTHIGLAIGAAAAHVRQIFWPHWLAFYWPRVSGETPKPPGVRLCTVAIRLGPSVYLLD